MDSPGREGAPTIYPSFMDELWEALPPDPAEAYLRQRDSRRRTLDGQPSQSVGTSTLMLRQTSLGRFSHCHGACNSSRFGPADGVLLVSDAAADVSGRTPT